ncbi:DUF3159 domain-containing protein [Streptomyces sp. CoH17]|uniref:DUF3159 domain-containing protein n=1 Tax=Streptomyces sp. CoH17 TaxID=2992806 RepID=UPI00226F8AF8|nr:DUF3159 domain-containing protein [Streptomyces sp. CoH17]
MMTGPEKAVTATADPVHLAESKTTPTLLDRMGGTTGLAYTYLPILVFVLTNSLFGLKGAIGSAIAVAVGLCILRLTRKEPVMPAVSGLFGVAVASYIAYQTGSAKGFFLVGIWASLIKAAIMLFSVLIRWPLVGVLVNLVNSGGPSWRRDKATLFAYDIATLTLFAVFAARFIVQQWLYEASTTGWLAFAKIAMGVPLYGLAAIVGIWAVRRDTKRREMLVGEPQATGAN